MSEVFNFRRFGEYAVRRYAGNWKKYLIGTAALFGVMIFFPSVLWFFEEPMGEQGYKFFYFVFLLLAATVLFVVTDMKPLCDRHTSAIENTVPASLLEKYLYVLLNTTVVLLAVYWLLYFMAALFASYVLEVKALPDYFRHMDITLFLIQIIFLPAQAAAFYSGTMERRNHLLSFISVGAVIFAVIFLAVFLPAEAGGLLAGNEHAAFGPFFMSFTAVIKAGSATLFYSANEPDWKLWTSIIVAAGTLMLWVAAWFNFRERSIK